MQYRDYGREGYQVSTFGMGCMRLPRRERPDGTVEVDREKAYELLPVPSNSFGVPGWFRLGYCIDYDVIVASLPAWKKLAEEYGV